MAEPRTIADINGALLDHFSVCGECDGYGVEDAADPESEPCSSCEGGTIRWGCFYEADVATCEIRDHVGKDEVGVAAMYDGGHSWSCLRCYVEDHADACGCHRWVWAEVLLGLPDREGRELTEALVRIEQSEDARREAAGKAAAARADLEQLARLVIAADLPGSGGEEHGVKALARSLLAGGELEVADG